LLNTIFTKMQFLSKDRKNLKASEEAKFIEQCKAEFIEGSLAETNSRKVKLLMTASYVPNIFSALTASFFILFLISSYSTLIASVLGFLLFLVAVAVELGKRGIISSLGKEYFTAGKIAALAVVGLALCFALSMGASYTGGKYLVTETAPTPPPPTNSKIDSLNHQLQLQQATIQKLQNTTWKGKVTRDANKGINEAKKIEALLLQRIAALEEKDEAAHQAEVEKVTSRNLNFGIVLGLLAALADFFLLGLIWQAKRLKYEVAATYTFKREEDEEDTVQTFSPYFRNSAPKQPSPSDNSAPRQPIGFRIPSITEQRTTENRTNGTAYTQPEAAQPEVVIQKEVVELSDRIKPCQHCGEKFVYYSSRAKYCSDSCRIAAWEARTGKTLKKRKKG